MDLESLKKEFDAMFDAVSDDELVAAFAQMGCEVELVVNHQVSEWVQGSPWCELSELYGPVTEGDSSIILFDDWGRLEASGVPTGRHLVEPEPVAAYAQAADSSELALAA